MLQRKDEIRLNVNAAKAEKNIEMTYAEIKAFKTKCAKCYLQKTISSQVSNRERFDGQIHIIVGISIPKWERLTSYFKSME